MTERVVLISGGSKGLGAGLVEAFLKRGDKVATFSRASTEAISGWQRDYPDRFLFAALDMTDSSACAEYLARVQATLGDVQVLVNNAGMAATSLLPLSDDSDSDAIIDLNLKGTVHLTRIVCRPMLSLGWGRIINISSVVGLSGYRGLSVYSATKAALDGFTRALARELGSRCITVNSVAPGYLTTELSAELGEEQSRQIIRRTPLGRLGRPEDIASAVTFLASDEAGFITGQVLVVDGGLSC
jgi:3-oxoacyl-[acyl-carrier protein] reductase